MPSTCTNNLLESCQKSPTIDFCSSYHNLYSLSKETIKSGTATSRIELSVLGLFVNIPLSDKYWLDLFMLIIPFFKSMSDHSSPASSPSLAPMNMSSKTATLYLMSLPVIFSKLSIRILV